MEVNETLTIEATLMSSCDLRHSHYSCSFSFLLPTTILDEQPDYFVVNQVSVFIIGEYPG